MVWWYRICLRKYILWHASSKTAYLLVHCHTCSIEGLLPVTAPLAGAAGVEAPPASADPGLSALWLAACLSACRCLASSLLWAISSWVNGLEVRKHHNHNTRLWTALGKITTGQREVLLRAIVLYYRLTESWFTGQSLMYNCVMCSAKVMRAK